MSWSTRWSSSVSCRETWAPQAIGRSARRSGTRTTARSVNHHYRENTPTPGYQLRTTEADLDLIRVLRTISCYQYQSCEHPEWADSDAHQLTNRLRDTLLQRHPQYAQKVPTPLGERHLYTTLPEYRQAPWGIESLDEALSAHHRPPAAQTAAPE